MGKFFFGNHLTAISDVSNIAVWSVPYAYAKG